MSEEVTREFIDPRIFPRPPCLVPGQPPADSPEELRELVALCQAGRIYAVEEWIRAGKSCWAKSYRVNRRQYVRSPLAVAVETNQEDLVRLFLCNGVPPDGGDPGLLTDVVADRRWVMLDVLVSFGADLVSVSPLEIVETYNAQLYDRYEAAGGDLTRWHALARSLGQHSSNRPGYGWAKKRKDEPRIARELSIALVEAVKEGKERAVALLLWAGADPHAEVTDISDRYDPNDAEEEGWTSAVHMAVLYDRGKILPLLKPDPAVDDFARLWRWTSSVDVAMCLGSIQLPESWSPTIAYNLEHWVEGWDAYEAERCLKYIREAFKARLESVSADELRGIRRGFREIRHQNRAMEVIRWLRRPQNCDPKVYARICRSKAVERLLALEEWRVRNGLESGTFLEHRDRSRR